MPRSKSPFKAWLVLSLAVLLLHLALLKSLPISLGQAAAMPLSFITRTVQEQPGDLAQAPLPAAVPTPKPTPRPKAQPATAPAQSLADAPAPVATPDTPDGVTQEQAPSPEEQMAEVQKQDEEVAKPEVAKPPEPVPADKTPKFSADGIPGSVKLLYEVEANKFPYNLNGELVWTQDGDRYLATLGVGFFGQKRTQTSQGLVGKKGLQPERFADKFRSEVAAHFDWNQAKVTFSANTPDMVLLSGAQDRLSVLIQLAAMVSSAPDEFAPGTTLSIQTVGPREADLWLFTLGNMETLELPNGNVQGLKLTRRPRQPHDQQVDIWLAPSLSYLPARIRITEANGDYIDQKWLSSQTVNAP